MKRGLVKCMSKNIYYNCHTLIESPSLMKPIPGSPKLDGVSLGRYSVIRKVKVLKSIWNKDPIEKKWDEQTIRSSVEYLEER
jgi:hypothetical protein